MANTKKDPCPKGQVPDGKGGCRELTMKEKMEKTNKRDKEFYDEMGPVPKGFTRAKFKPTFSDELIKDSMAMGGTKKTVIKKPLKTAMYGTAMKPVKTKMAMGGSTKKTMGMGGMSNKSMMKKGGTKKK